MTRFARASGSKASNERVEENADSWSEMKKQIANKNQEEIEDKKQKKVNKARMANYKKFLEEEKATKTPEWCDFSDSETKASNKKGKAKKKNKPVVKEVSEDEDDTSEQEENDFSEANDISEHEDDTSKEEENDTSEANNISEHEDDTSEQEENDTSEANDISDHEDDTSKEEENDTAEANNISEHEDDNSEQEENDTSKVNDSEQNNDSGSEPETQKIEKTGKQIIKKKMRQDKPIPNKAKNITNKPKQQKEIIKYNKKGKPIKTKIAKPRDNLVHQRKKSDPPSTVMVINGKEIEVRKFDGFPVMMNDYKRLENLKKSMISKGIPRQEVTDTMKLERRKAEKALTRQKKKVCYQCRKSGHMLSECPEIGSRNVQTSGSGICFKCGSGEHTHYECKVQRQQVFKFAECFVCKEQGHIARQCPDNPKGRYPQGGACNVCGDVTHLKKDCPQYQKETEESAILLPTNGGSVEGIVEDIGLKRRGEKLERKAKIVKF